MESIKEILSMPTLKFVEWLENRFSYETPPRMETTDDINRGLDMLRVYTGVIEYLKELETYAKVYSREAKRKGKEFKAEYEDMVDRREAISNKIDSIKLSYQTVNKCVTVAIEQRKFPTEQMRTEE